MRPTPAIALLSFGLGCSVGPWTRAAALNPTVQALDADHNGRLTIAEYERVAYGGPGFAAVDADKDGDVSVTELDAAVTQTDPVLFSMQQRGGPPTGPSNPQSKGPRDVVKRPTHGQVWEVLSLLREEVLARDPSAVVPSPEAILAADTAGGLDGPLAVEALTTLQTASDAAGIEFPASLRN